MIVRKVLIPLDGSELAEAVLPLVERLLQGVDDAEIVLMGVVEPKGQLSEEEHETALRTLRTRYKHMPARVHLVHGDPAHEILTASEVLRPDLVAMASHGRSGLSRVIRGSVTERVLRSCVFPLLIVRPATDGDPEPSFRRILVPLDGSPLSDQVLPYVEWLAKTFGSAIKLLSVETPVDFATAPVPEDPARIAATLDPQRERLEAVGVSVEAVGVQGLIVDELLRAAEGADLVAMSTHGRSGISRWWFGSVAEQVLRHCPTPLLVLRPPR